MARLGRAVDRVETEETYPVAGPAGSKEELREEQNTRERQKR